MSSLVQLQNQDEDNTGAFNYMPNFEINYGFCSAHVKYIIVKVLHGWQLFEENRELLNFDLCDHIYCIRYPDQLESYRDSMSYSNRGEVFMALLATQGREIQDKIFELTERELVFPENDDFLQAVTQLATGTKEQRNANLKHFIWVCDKILEKWRACHCYVPLSPWFYKDLVKELKKRLENEKQIVAKENEAAKNRVLDLGLGLFLGVGPLLVFVDLFRMMFVY